MKPKLRVIHPYEPKVEEDIGLKYREVRNVTEELCLPLKTEDMVVQSMPDASPVKWHLAHTSWFFETFIIRKAFPQYEELPGYDFLFNSYYHSVGRMHPRAERGMVTRPSVEEIFQYRKRVDEGVFNLMSSAASREFLSLILVGIHHEQQHQELLLTDLKHLLAMNPLKPAYTLTRPAPNKAVYPLEWVTYPEGLYAFGHEGESFAYDNETPRHRQLIHSFQIATRLVTAAEYLEFMRDGGYRKPALWLSDGWRQVIEQGWQAPLYWEKRDGTWFEYALTGMRPVEPQEPVMHVSYYEADAFARWAGARLPTEYEWEIASLAEPVEGNFLEAGYFHALPQINASRSVAQLFGDAWEWTSSPYSPYPGYRPAEGALGEYNGKFMCNQMVLRGGSCATPISHIRKTYRNFFGPEKRWQFTGIRLARNLS